MKARSSKKNRLQLLHQYYNYTGFYSFIGNSVKKAFVPIACIVVGLILINEFVYDINEGLQQLTTTLSKEAILVTFFISETILGLLPPEVFIAWSKKTSDPILNLSILAILSYVGGLISYFLGKATLSFDTIKNSLEIKMARHLKNTKKWGSFLILAGALLPIPFSMTCIAAGMINYSFKNVVLFGLFRFARFAIYAWAIFKVVT